MFQDPGLWFSKSTDLVVHEDFVICHYILKGLLSFWSAIYPPGKDTVLLSVGLGRIVTAWKVN